MYFDFGSTSYPRVKNLKNCTKSIIRSTLHVTYSNSKLVHFNVSNASDNRFVVGMCAGRIPYKFVNSQVVHCGTIMLLLLKLANAK